MPFRSEAQRKFLWARHPEVAKEWAHKYDTPEDLPERKGKKHTKSYYDKAMDGLKRAKS